MGPRRLYLTPNIVLEGEDGAFHDQRLLPGRQGRAAFAFLVLQRLRPVTRGELADAIWTGELPPSWETSISAIGSKIRSLLGRWDPRAKLEGALGCYQLQLPADAWVDIEVARETIHIAEPMARTDPVEAESYADIAHKIAERSFLPGDEAPWIDEVRRELADILVRACIVKGATYSHRGDHGHAITVCEIGLKVDPFSEPLYRRLIRTHAAAGNRADAARAYKRCCDILRDELGVSPSADTDAVFAEARDGA